MTCPICERSLSPEEIENDICVGCEHGLSEVTEQQKVDAKEDAECQHYETEPLSGQKYSI